MLCNSTILKQDKTKFIYGAEWAGTENPAWVRTDNAIGFEDPQPAVAGGTGSSPFDNIMPWSGMVRVTNSEAGEVVAIPKFYCKWTQTDSKLKLQISMYQYPGFICSPAHMDRGDGKGERNIIYVGRYYSNNIDYKSVTDASLSNTYIKSMINTVNNLGNTIWTLDFATLVTIQMLYLVEFATWDSQAVIGRGNNIAQANIQKTGTTDSMQYHTGTMQNSRDTIGNGIQYRYIEDLWSNAKTPIVGCYADTIVNNKNVIIGYELKVAINPTHFIPLINQDDSSHYSYFSGGTTIATENDTSVAYSESLAKSVKISNIENLNWAYFVNSSVTIDNNYHKYLCDTQDMDFTSANSRDTLELGKGGSGDDALGYGLFNLGLDDINSSGVESIRLMILP